VKAYRKTYFGDIYRPSEIKANFEVSVLKTLIENAGEPLC